MADVPVTPDAYHRRRAGGRIGHTAARSGERPAQGAGRRARPFLDYVLAYLAEQGIEKVILSVGYLAGQVMAFAARWHTLGPGDRLFGRSTPLGTGGALRLAARGAWHGRSTPSTGILFYAAANLENAVAAPISSHRPCATIALLPVAEGRERGCVTLVEDGRILSFRRKTADAENRRSDQRRGVCYLSRARPEGDSEGQPAFP